ncbi:GNAT family N-acetyltransferase [Candidatus Mesenet endosymbiont of Agriotes lineatus]|uniref:GNAT family N-acetyltransferase n=1 Tax=Candidatus Mesenet endosymbiont of Agriotes lineatus TaxID=3077948 RepID=UPI0030D35600
MKQKNSILKSSLVTKNLRDYIIDTTKLSNWEIHKFNNLTVTIGSTSQSLFNYVFYTEEGEFCIESVREVLSYLQERKIEATWPIDSHIKVRTKLENLGIKSSSTPKKAFLNIRNYLPSQDKVSNLVLKVVSSQEDLTELDKITSVIFYHDIGIVSTFLRGILNHDNQASKLKFFLVKLNDKTVGTCGIYIEDEIAGFYSDGVLPMYRNQGIATEMVMQRIKIAQQHCCKYVIAHCMKSSVNLYKRVGFKMLGNLHLYVSS